MRWKYLSLFPIALLCLGIGTLLLPSEREIAQMNLKSKKFGLAETFYADQRTQGSRPVATASALLGIYLNDGRIDEAIAVLEELVATQPDNLEARRYLGKLFVDTQRFDDYARNLQQLNDLAPTEGQQRELIDIYDRNEAFDSEIAGLRTLLAAYKKTPQDAYRLALLLADRGDLTDAASVLHSLASEQPNQLNHDMRRLLFRLSIDTGAINTAGTLARDWVATGTNSGEVPYFVNEMLSRGRFTEATMIFEPFWAIAANDPSLQPTLLNLLIAGGKTEEALTHFAALQDTGHLPGERLAQYVSLTLATGNMDLAKTLTSSDKLKDMPADLLTQIVDDAYAQTAFPVVSSVGAIIADEDLAKRPLVGAKIAIAQNDMPAAAQWAIVAQQSGNRSTTATVELAEILIQLGDRPDAIALLSDLVMHDNVPPQAYPILARLYISQGQAEIGFKQFEQLRASSNTFHEPSWALLATQTQRPELVLDWLETVSNVHPDDLADIASAALTTGVGPVALVASKRLFALRDGRQERLLLAEALLQTGHADDALEHLRLLVSDTPDAEVAFVKALHASGAQEELSQYLARIEEDTANGPVQTSLIFDLLEGEEDQEYLLPYVKRLAHDIGGDWLYTYVELARQTQQDTQLVGFLETELDRSGMSLQATDDRLSLLGTVAPARALAVAERLASQSPAVWNQRYIDLMRDLGDTQGIQADILRQLADQNASEEEIAALTVALIDSGEFSAALPTTRRLAEVKGGDWLFTYGEIANKAGRKDELATFLTTEIHRPDLEDAAIADRVEMLVATAPAVASAELRLLVDQNPRRWFSSYVNLLRGQNDTNGINRLIEQQLRSNDVPQAQIEALVYSLIEADEPQAALPSVRWMAEALDGDWAFTYVDLARQAGLDGEAINFLNHQLNRKDLGKAAFLDLVGLLISTDPVVALAILKHRSKADGGRWYDAYTEAQVAVRPTDRQFASSLETLRFLAKNIGGHWLSTFADKLRDQDRVTEFTEFLAQQRARTDLEPANAETIAQMWLQSQS